MNSDEVFLGDGCPVTYSLPDVYYEFFYHPHDCGIISQPLQEVILLRTKIKYISRDSTVRSEMPLSCVVRNRGTSLFCSDGSRTSGFKEVSLLDLPRIRDYRPPNVVVDTVMPNSGQNPLLNAVEMRDGENVTEWEIDVRIHIANEDEAVTSTTQSCKNLTAIGPCSSNECLYCKRRNSAVCFGIERQFEISAMAA
ncbi:putative oocyte-secreted protein 1 homolog [Callithrix jacchus]|uniref:putative oocyte-secreted protein 1 homolog n=1 Tax=Callithrix jacchus TaxID=9483 RepID=UPI00159F6474|nr:putative oocyte-secreted protein 1 homolog [Callithrix jacchus]XP_035118695.1 putative oocyte-secreted protein 1 homolog [Callithrix jacchus]